MAKSAPGPSPVSDAPYSTIAADNRDPWSPRSRYQRNMKTLLMRLWRRPSLRLCSASETLELPLLRSRRLRLATRVFMAAVLLHALELALMEHLVAAPSALLLAAGIAARRTRPGESPHCLVLAADGRLFLCWREREMEQVQLLPASLRLGSHLLLILRGNRRTFRVLLGPDNLSAHLLAAFKRRLPGPGHAGTALH
jgi:hypothetical protein